MAPIRLYKVSEGRLDHPQINFAQVDQPPWLDSSVRCLRCCVGPSLPLCQGIRSRYLGLFLPKEGRHSLGEPCVAGRHPSVWQCAADEKRAQKKKTQY
ncbi:hypothetical protein BJX61DRAFT_196901 [Aspergillus egyptiacus]|nr:hypothetical protein BJX61DRAFT_196901 [Aspergillus egyptiacus]